MSTPKSSSLYISAWWQDPEQINHVQKSSTVWISDDFKINSQTKEVDGTGIIIDPQGDLVDPDNPEVSKGITGWKDGVKNFQLTADGVFKIGSTPEGNGWLMFGDGLFSYAAQHPLHAFANADGVPWQQTEGDYIEPVNPSFTLGIGDVVLGLFNYKQKPGGEPFGGLFWDQSDKKLYFRGEVATGSSVDWSTVSGSNKPADNATVGATWGQNISSQPGALAEINWNEGNKLGGVAYNADVTADVFTGTTLTKTAGNVVLNSGADLLMHGASADTSSIFFKPIPANYDTWTYLRGDYVNSQGRLYINPQNNLAAHLYVGVTGQAWKHMEFQAESISFSAGTLSGVAPSTHYHNQYASTSHTHSGYASTTHNHMGVYAGYSHSHSGYASSSHNHDGVYAGYSHSHSYAPSTHYHDRLYFNGTTTTGLYATSSAIYSYTHFYPYAANNKYLGHPTRPWLHGYIKNLHFCTQYDLCASFPQADRECLPVLKALRGLVDGEGNAVMGAEGIQKVDKTSYPDWLTNKEALYEEFRAEWGEMTSWEDFEALWNDGEFEAWKSGRNTDHVLDVVTGALLEVEARVAKLETGG